MAYFIPHGSLNDKNQMYDARIKAWINLPQNDINELKNQYYINSTLSSEWLENNCHEDGVFKCSRCYRKHFIPDNFDFLCDGCVDFLLKEFPQHQASIKIQEWKNNTPLDLINYRIALRAHLSNVLSSDTLSYQNQSIVVIRELMKNDGNLLVCYSEADLSKKENHFTLNVLEINYV